MRKLFLLVILTGTAWGAETGTLTDQEMKARMPADVGPATLDVSAYPLEQQTNYQLLENRCSRCHSPARPLNSRIVSREDWEHFVSLMHGRLLSRDMKEPWTMEEGRRIVEFLTYDSQIRKVQHKKDFDLLQKRLGERFKEVQKEKARLAEHQPIKPSAPYTGDRP